MHKFIFILFFISTLFCFSCKTKQNIVYTSNNNSSSAHTDIVKKDSTSIIDTSFTIQNQSNTWYSSRISIEISSATTDEISAFLVCRRDSIIYLNINKFGIELARAVLRPDSVTMVNRFEKTFYKGDYSIVKQLYGFSLNYNVIQSIILCEDFSSYSSGLKLVTSNDSLITVNYPKRVNSSKNSFIQQEISYNKSLNKIVTSTIKDLQTMRLAKINYTQFEQVETFLFPHIYTITLPDVTIKIETKSSRVNTPGPTSLTIPQKYTPMFPKNGNP
jgi:hypothetical protein